MVYRHPNAGPGSSMAEERRGRVVGRFCKTCGGVYALYAERHHGKPIYGKDHVSSPCTHEGDDFAAGETWWEPAIELLPESPETQENQQ